MMLRLLAGLFALLLMAVPAQADEVRPASIDFTETTPGEWSLDWKQPVASPGAVQFIVPTLPQNCAIEGEIARSLGAAALIGNAQVRCEGEVSGGTIGLPELAGKADALVRIAPLDREVQSHRLTASAPLATIIARPDRWQVLRSYFVIGTEHILMGWDHLLFVVALVLLVVGGWQVVKAATAFTIAHSITLVATTLGMTGLPQKPVEALIALSIVFLAVELLHTDRETWTRRWPWLVAFGFGLLHGFGFAGALREIGLPEGEVPAALFAFNVGVEAGQLLVIAAVIGLRHAVTRLAPKAEQPALRFATYGIGITASYWLIDRLVG
ncbi:HupE/UreJ family protein [Altererythrobacter arenosus]|uniref:HupE/UreJ family protein n=1 Tax=Altererythrobacter arenosus TaxID=3032592 RepID=A0ABY8FLU8_9SPHN|nr:HupE/UreJ family protein [Altererythrobacter sp. CAU 1644]WFL75983.1 HupE/UreJ family protein [Altererythrobacter sp. CAU 1644]